MICGTAYGNNAFGSGIAPSGALPIAVSTARLHWSFFESCVGSGECQRGALHVIVCARSERCASLQYACAAVGSITEALLFVTRRRLVWSRGAVVGCPALHNVVHPDKDRIHSQIVKYSTLTRRSQRQTHLHIHPRTHKQTHRQHTNPHYNTHITPL